MKKLKKILLIISLIPCVFLLNACSIFKQDQVFVTNIVKTEVVGDTATYTIHYSDGSTSLFSVKNGSDGEDGNDLTIESIKNYCEENSIDFDTFIEKYLTVIKTESVVEDATNIAIQSAVTVWCEFPTMSAYFEKSTSLACGAGVIYKMDDEYSYILTNYHVVYSPETKTTNHIASRINIFQYGGEEAVYDTGETNNGYPTYTYGHGAVEVEFIGGTLNYDLAVLRVQTAKLLENNEYAKAASVATEYNIGESAIAIGNPECEGFSVTSGIISVVSETIEMTGADNVTNCKFRVMRIDTAVNSGNSGGGLFNMDGELMGIVNAKAVSSDIDNIAYSLPIDNVTKVADNLIYYYELNRTPSQVKKLVLDIQYSASNSHAVYNPTTNRTIIVDDFKVESVTVNGVGYYIGLEIGDIVKSVSINGNVHNITRAYQLADLMLTIRTGDKIVFNVNRGGNIVDLGITNTLGVLPTQLQIVE